MRMDCSKDWHKTRSRMYAELARKKDVGAGLDSVFFRLHSPEVGCIDFDVFVNGEEHYSSMFSEIFDPFQNIRSWLEAIAKESAPVQSLCIGTEGPQMIWVYEVLRGAEYDYSLPDDLWGSKIREPEIGLFYIFEASSHGNIFVKAIVDTKEFVTALYLALLDLAANGYNRGHSDFGKQWYAPQTLWGRSKRTNWAFYNSMKSSFLEWYIHSGEQYSSFRHLFVRMPPVKETVQMWCDYGEALFWGRGNDGHGACIGDAGSFDTYTCGTIDLSSIEGLREWYDEWNKTSLENILEEENESVGDEWFERGRQLALKVRELLPDTVDLYYYNWYPTVEVLQDGDNHFPERIPMIVPNMRSLRKEG